jgi:hypothetical protein
MSVAIGSTLLTSEQAEDFLSIAHGTLSVWRCTRRYSIPFIKVGRCVRYRLVDLEAFLVSRTVSGASQG